MMSESDSGWRADVDEKSQQLTSLLKSDWAAIIAVLAAIAVGVALLLRVIWGV